MPFNNFVKIDFFGVLASLGSVLNDFGWLHIFRPNLPHFSGVHIRGQFLMFCDNNFSEFSIEIYILARIMGKIYFLKGLVSSLDLYYSNFTKIEIE